MRKMNTRTGRPNGIRDDARGKGFEIPELHMVRTDDGEPTALTQHTVVPKGNWCSCKKIPGYQPGSKCICWLGYLGATFAGGAPGGNPMGFGDIQLADDRRKAHTHARIQGGSR